MRLSVALGLLAAGCDSVSTNPALTGGDVSSAVISAASALIATLLAYAAALIGPLFEAGLLSLFL